MIVGSYVLRLYCDTCTGWHGRRDHDGDRVIGQEFSADTKQAAYRAARKRGWRITEKTGFTVCPECLNKPATSPVS